MQTQRQKRRSASRSLRSNCQHLGSSSLSLSVISGLPLSMEDLLVPMDGTTSTPCISTASSFVTASSYCGDADEMFQFDPFSEPFKTEVCLTTAIHYYVHYSWSVGQYLRYLSSYIQQAAAAHVQCGDENHRSSQRRQLIMLVTTEGTEKKMAEKACNIPTCVFDIPLIFVSVFISFLTRHAPTLPYNR